MPSDIVATATESDADRVRQLEEEVKSLKRAAAKSQRDEDRIAIEVRNALPDRVTLRPPTRPKADRRRANPETHVLVLSDTQIGKRTPTYDVPTAERRVMDCAKRVAKIAAIRRAATPCPELHIYWAGDMVEGEMIFGGQAWEVEMGVYEQAIRATPPILAKSALYLMEHYERVKIIAVPGNHGRTGAINLPSHPKTSWDRVACDVAALLIQQATGSPPPVVVSDDFYVVDRLPGGWGVLVVHGDQIGGMGTSGVFERALSGWVEAIPEPWDVCVMGHFHRAISWPVHDRRLIINGSTESPDSGYVRARIKSGGSPSQTFLVFDEQRGLISESRIYLSDRTPNT